MTTGKRNQTGDSLMRAETIPRAPLILIAEEQPAIRELLRQALCLAQYQTTLCADRQAALLWREQVVTSEEVPVVLLLDLSPFCVSEATDFLACLRTRWQAAYPVPPQIIVLTTQPQVQAELRTQERMLLKPFHVRDLLALVGQATAVAPQ